MNEYDHLSREELLQLVERQHARLKQTEDDILKYHPEVRKLRIRDDIISRLSADQALDEITETSSIANLIKNNCPKPIRVAVLKPYRAKDPDNENGYVPQLGVIGQAGFSKEYTHFSFPVTKGISGLAFATQQPVIENNVQNNPRYFQYSSDPTPIKSMISVPVLNEQQHNVKYVIAVESEHEGAFNDDDIYVFKSVAHRLTEWYTHLDRMEQDNLTLLFNRNRFNRAFSSLSTHAKKNKQPLGLILIDINNLKQVNDEYGHPVGDRYIAAVGRGIRQTLDRRDDTGFRLGGDEMAVLLPATNRVGVYSMQAQIALNVNKEVRSEEAKYLEIEFPEYPIAIGAGEYLDHIEKDVKRSFFDAVDHDQYEDKKLVKTQSHWPSEQEQMDVLKEALAEVGITRYSS